MVLGSTSSTSAPPRSSTATPTWLRRAFEGLTWQHVGIVIVLCAIWAASASTHDVLRSWHEGRFLDWLVHDLGEGFACMVVIALAMGLPILAVGNLGPQSGWRRIAALALVIALVAPAGAVLVDLFGELLTDWMAGRALPGRTTGSSCSGPATHSRQRS